MKLAAKEVGQSFVMHIAGYQSPQIATEPYDSNWLVISGSVVHPTGTWHFRDPCLLTYEAARLADWLESIAAGNTLPKECCFTEPNLSFETIVNKEQPMLRIYFELES